MSRHADTPPSWLEFEDLEAAERRFAELKTPLRCAPGPRVEEIRAAWPVIGQGGVLLVLETWDPELARTALVTVARETGDRVNAVRGAIGRMPVYWIERRAPSAPVVDQAEGEPVGDGLTAWRDLVEHEEVRRLVQALPATVDAWDAEEATLRQAGVLAPSGHGLDLTVAGAVLLARDPAELVPGAAVVVGPAGGPHTTCSAPLRRLVGRAESAAVSLLDHEVVEELVLNALLHRRWSVPEPVRVEVLDERCLRITSPGVLASRDWQVHPRNPRLVQLAQRMGLTRGTGHMARLVERGWSVDVDERFGRVQLTVREPPPRRRVATPAPRSSAEASTRSSAEGVSTRAAPPVVSPAPSPTRTATPARPLTARQQDVVDLLQRRGALARADIEEALGVGRSTVRDLLAALIERGVLRQVEDDPRSPHQLYELAG